MPQIIDNMHAFITDRSIDKDKRMQTRVVAQKLLHEMSNLLNHYKDFDSIAKMITICRFYRADSIRLMSKIDDVIFYSLQPHSPYYELKLQSIYAILEAASLGLSNKPDNNDVFRNESLEILIDHFKHHVRKYIMAMKDEENKRNYY
jgi:hypothetical protein